MARSISAASSESIRPAVGLRELDLHHSHQGWRHKGGVGRDPRGDGDLAQLLQRGQAGGPHTDPRCQVIDGSEGRGGRRPAAASPFASRCLLGVKGGCRRQVDGTAGMPSAPEMPCARKQLRLVPRADFSVSKRFPGNQRVR